MQPLTIDGRPIGAGAPAFVIAEVGVNHNGDPALAARMVDAIADAGADCVKFQTFSAEEFVSNPDDTYEYESQGRRVRESMLEMFQRLELKREEFRTLFARARARGLVPLSTPTDRDAVDLLDELGAGAFKVGSDDLVYTPFLEYVADKGKPVILSTGMADEADVARAVAAVRGRGNDRIVLLHCVSSYPTPPAELNLRKIETLRSRFGVHVGFSDHSDGILAAGTAVGLGACVVEKHFTLDRNLPGPDHRFSADPAELAALVRRVREVETTLGEPAIVPTAPEREMAKLARRSIVAARDLPAGHRLAAADLAYKRPGTGLMPYRTVEVLGRRLRHAVAINQPIALEGLE